MNIADARDDRISLGIHMEKEILSQPAIWEMVLSEPIEITDALPGPDDDVVVVGCGTSHYVADAYVCHREAIGRGITRSVVASELERVHQGETVLCISRSGTTRDVLRVAETYKETAPILAIIGIPEAPLAKLCDRVAILPYADEESTVQTRFPTSVLTLLRRSLGEDLSALPGEAREALKLRVAIDDLEHFVFLGSGAGAGLAAEAALKCRESAGVWAEAYPVNEYLHGPVSAASARSLVWSLSPIPEDVLEVVQSTGATVRQPTFEPQVELVACQMTALRLARRYRRDPDHPPFLQRSVI